MTECLGSWEHFLNERDRFPDLVACALMHEQFEAIHPFSEISLEAVGRAGRLTELREKLRKKLARHGNAARLLDELFRNPYVTVARAQKLLGVSNPTARQAVKRLQDAGILHETTGREWGRLYLARPILRVLALEEGEGK